MWGTAVASSTRESPRPGLEMRPGWVGARTVPWGALDAPCPRKPQRLLWGRGHSSQGRWALFPASSSRTEQARGWGRRASARRSWELGPLQALNSTEASFSSMSSSTVAQTLLSARKQVRKDPCVCLCPEALLLLVTAPAFALGAGWCPNGAQAVAPPFPASRAT